MGEIHPQSHINLDKQLQQKSWNKLQIHTGLHEDIYKKVSLC